MNIPKYIEIKNADGKTTAYLSPTADGLKDVYPDARLNGESTLEFMLPATSEKVSYIDPECEIWAGDRVFSLLKDDAIDFIRDDSNKQWAKVMAVERWHDLDYDYPEPYICNDPTIDNPADLTVVIVGGGSDLSGGRYDVGTAGHALYAVLYGSEWSVGTVDVPGIYDLEMEKTSRLELIRAIQEIWGGYIVWDSVNKTVSLRSGDVWQPYNGFQIRYKKNLKHITRTQSNKIYTKIYPFGHDDLDISSVNGGKKYITNYSYTSRTYVGIYKNQDIYDAQELKDKATAELELNCRPRYNYKVKIADLRTLPEYAHEEFSLGDMADVIDPSAGNVRIRILRHKYNMFMPWDCEIELGDPEERLIEQLKASFDTNGFIDSKFNGSGRFSGHSLEYESVSADKIKVDELVVGDNIQMGPNATISWGQVEDQPFIPDTDFITTITEDTIMTTNIYARNLTVSAANISGTLEAHQITSDISRVNWSLEVGAPNEYGEILLYGSSDLPGIEIAGTYQGQLEIFNWDGSIWIQAWGNLLLEGYNIEITGSPVEITSYNGYDIDIYSGRDLYLDARYDIILSWDSYLGGNTSDDNLIATLGDIGSGGGGDTGEIWEYIEDYVVESYTKATKCYVSASSYGITVRDRNGNVLGDIYYD